MILEGNKNTPILTRILLRKQEKDTHSIYRLKFQFIISWIHFAFALLSYFKPVSLWI